MAVMEENMQSVLRGRTMSRTALAMGIIAMMSGMSIYAADAPAPDQAVAPAPADAAVPAAAATPAPAATQPTPTMVPNEASAASQALKQKAGDSTAATNLDQTFKATERQYSLSKQGSYQMIYDVNYSYYANTVLDLALDSGSSTINRLRVENNAQHALTNTFTFQYGLLNNLTLTGSLPFVAKVNPPTNASTFGLGDLSLGARWEPFPLGTTPLPITLLGTFTAPSGTSPYTINTTTGMSTGQGYYSFGGGISTRKFIDPIVLFGTLSANAGLSKGGLSQNSGTRTLVEVNPGYTVGYGMGFAYSLNYDVSLTVSYQQSFVFNSQYRFRDRTTAGPDLVSTPTTSSSATLTSSLGIRVSPKTIVNVSLGFGLTPDSPNVLLGLSLPLDFLGLSRQVQ
jgi:hypothetical protein